MNKLVDSYHYTYIHTYLFIYLSSNLVIYE